MVRSHQGVDGIFLEDPKQTSSPCCQESRCGPDVHSSPSHRVGHQLFYAAPPNSSLRVRGGELATSSAPSPFGLLGGGSSLILSILRGPPGFTSKAAAWV